MITYTLFVLKDSCLNYLIKPYLSHTNLIQPVDYLLTSIEIKIMLNAKSKITPLLRKPKEFFNEHEQ